MSELQWDAGLCGGQLSGTASLPDPHAAPSTHVRSNDAYIALSDSRRMITSLPGHARMSKKCRA